MQKFMFTKMIVIFSFLIMSFIQTSYAGSFSDLNSSHRNYDAIEYVKTKDIVKGYSDGTFRPFTDILRAEYVKILIETEFDRQTIDTCMTDADKQKPNPFFSDLHKGDWFVPYVCVAVKNDMIGGYPDGTFRPANKIAFVEAAKILVNAFEPGTVKTSENDEWFKSYVIKLADERRAVPGSVHSFDKNMLRGEVAEMIYRIKEDIRDRESPSFKILNCSDGNVTIQSHTEVDSICVRVGNVTLDSHVKVKNGITILKGNLSIGFASKVGGDIKMIEEGRISIDSHGGEFGGDIVVERGDVNLGGFLEIKGKVESLQGNIIIRERAEIDNGIYAEKGKITLRGSRIYVKNGSIIAGYDIYGDGRVEAESIISHNGSIDLGDYIKVKKDVIALKDISMDDYFEANRIISIKGNIEIEDGNSTITTIAADSGMVDLEGIDVTTLYAKNGASFGGRQTIDALYGKVNEEGDYVTINKILDFKPYYTKSTANDKFNSTDNQSSDNSSSNNAASDESTTSNDSESSSDSFVLVRKSVNESDDRTLYVYGNEGASCIFNTSKDMCAYKVEDNSTQKTLFEMREVDSEKWWKWSIPIKWVDDTTIISQYYYLEDGEDETGFNYFDFSNTDKEFGTSDIFWVYTINYTSEERIKYVGYKNQEFILDDRVKGKLVIYEGNRSNTNFHKENDSSGKEKIELHLNLINKISELEIENDVRVFPYKEGIYFTDSLEDSPSKVYNIDPETSKIKLLDNTLGLSFKEELSSD